MPSHPNNLTLLLGASGILGDALAQRLGPSAVLRTHLGRPRPDSVFFDARTMDAQALWQGREPPRSAVVMLGITAIDACARDPEGTARTNVEAVIRVIGQLADAGVAPVFASSDGVLDGRRAWSTEDDPAHPILEYGRQKLAVERFMAEAGIGLAVRLPKLLEPHGHGSGLLPGWISALGRPDTITCATDQFFTPVAAADAATAICALMDKGSRGLCHVAGSRRLSRRELLAEVMDEYSRFARPQAAIAECSLADIPVFEARPLDTSMRCDRLCDETGLVLPEAGAAARETVRRHFSSQRDITA